MSNYQERKCPLCKDANDFRVSREYQLTRGYCGFVIGSVKVQWQAAVESQKPKTPSRNVKS